MAIHSFLSKYPRSVYWRYKVKGKFWDFFFSLLFCFVFLKSSLTVPENLLFWVHIKKASIITRLYLENSMSVVSRRLGKEEESLYSAQNKYSVSKCFAASLCSRPFCL